MIELKNNIQCQMKEYYSIKKLTWFQVGGPARFFFKPKNIDDLSCFMKNRDESIPFIVLGAGSNILFHDDGFDGVVIKLPASFAEIEIQEEIVIVGAAALDRTLALQLAEKGLSNLEFFVGIPGTIGGAICMNAGAYGTETIDHLLWVDVMLNNGEIQRFEKKDLSMTYRSGNLPQDSIVIKAAFNVKKNDVNKVREAVQNILKQRSETQPVVGRTGGSTFKNPPNESAWKLIDRAGCRGYAIGDAQVSEKHCNFIMNKGHATASDIYNLGEYVRCEVKKNAQIDLKWEIKLIGCFK